MYVYNIDQLTQQPKEKLRHEPVSVGGEQKKES